MFFDRADADWRRYKTACWAVLFAAFLLAMLLAWLPVDHTIGRFIYDDMFYYLRVAEFIAEGRGSTFDGLSPTNGYHPVWMLVCTGLALFFSGNLLVHAALTVAAVLHVLQGYFLLRILAHFVRPAIGLSLTGLYLLNWRSLAINLCGLETALATLMVLIVFQRLLLWPVSTSFRSALVTGLLVGFAALCRFDLLLLVGFVGLWVVLDRRYPSSVTLTRRLALGLVTGLAALAVLCPWFAFSLRVSGSLLPNSRTAVALLGGPEYDFTNPAQIAEQLHEQMWSFLWWSSDIANFLGLFPIIAPQGRGMVLAGFLVLLLFLAVCVGILAFRTEQRARLAGLALLYCAIHAGYYALFHRIELRYVFPPLALFFIPLAVVVELTLERFPARKSAAVAITAFIIMCLFSLGTGLTAYSMGHASVRVHKYHYVALDTARWLARTHPGVKVGAWNAGILGYFSDTVLINLDGVVNDRALEAIKAQQIDQYIQHTGIRFLVDEPGQMEANLDRFSVPGMPRDWLGPVLHSTSDSEGRLIVVREVLPP